MLAAAGLAPGGARAQGRAALLPGRGADPGALGALPAYEPLERDLPARAGALAPTLDPARVAAVARVDALLDEASAHTAALREDAALASLATAARLCEQLGDVPGAAAWSAEVERQLGVSAMRAGLHELAAFAFRRAALLEPGRALLPAEAPPEVVARHEDARAELAAAPEGELRVRAGVAGARVFVDDVDRGVAPLRVRVPVGRHLLRVQADGHRPYGAFVDVLAGERPPLHVELSPLPALEAARALAVAAADGRYAQVPALLASVAPLGVTSALIVEPGVGGRRLLVRCDLRGCAGPSRLAPGELTPDGERPFDAHALHAARRWLSTPEAAAARIDRDDEAPGFSRWAPWVGAAVAVSAGVMAALLLQPAPRRELTVVVDPGML